MRCDCLHNFSEGRAIAHSRGRPVGTWSTIRHNHAQQFPRIMKYDGDGDMYLPSRSIGLLLVRNYRATDRLTLSKLADVIAALGRHVKLELAMA